MRSLVIALIAFAAARAAVPVVAPWNTTPREFTGIQRLRQALVTVTRPRASVAVSQAPGEPEGYRLQRRGDVWTVSGSDSSGVLYGCFEPARRVRETGALPESLDIAGHPQFRLRGPNIYKALWTRYLDFLLENRMNTLYLWNGHPFTSLLKLPEYPEARELTDAQLERLRTYPNVGLMMTLWEALAPQYGPERLTQTVIPGVKDGIRALGTEREPPIIVRAHAAHIANIHLLSTLEPYRWGDPEFIRQTLLSCKRIGVQGVHVYPLRYWDWPNSADNPAELQFERDWIWFEAWARYAWNPDHPAAARGSLEMQAADAHLYDTSGSSGFTTHAYLPAFDPTVLGNPSATYVLDSVQVAVVWAVQATIRVTKHTSVTQGSQSFTDAVASVPLSISSLGGASVSATATAGLYSGSAPASTLLTFTTQTVSAALSPAQQPAFCNNLAADMAVTLSCSDVIGVLSGGQCVIELGVPSFTTVGGTTTYGDSAGALLRKRETVVCAARNRLANGDLENLALLPIPREYRPNSSIILILQIVCVKNRVWRDES